MRQVTGYSVWLGHAGDLRDSVAIMNAGIEAVFELADSDQLAVLPRELVRLRFPLSDGGDNPPWLLGLAVESVATMLRARVPVLVCCSAGMSRSVGVAAGGVAIAERKSLEEALSTVAAAGPADVSPGMYMQIQKAVSGRV